MFGSRAAGTNSTAADYDLCVKELSMTDERWAEFVFRADENSPTLCQFDWHRYNSIKNKELLNRIDRDGRRIYAKDQPKI